MKRLLSIALVLCALFTLAACGGEEEKKQETPVTLDLPGMYAQMEEHLPDMAQLSEDAMLNRYGIKAEDVAEAYVYVSVDGLIADEVWLIKAADADSLATLETLAKNRIQAKDEESVTYSPEQNKIVKQGQILKRGDYLALIVAPTVDTLVGIFNG